MNGGIEASLKGVIEWLGVVISMRLVPSPRLRHEVALNEERLCIEFETKWSLGPSIQILRTRFQCFQTSITFGIKLG